MWTSGKLWENCCLGQDRGVGNLLQIVLKASEKGLKYVEITKTKTQVCLKSREKHKSALKLHFP
jgi:hypothetical protein